MCGKPTGESTSFLSMVSVKMMGLSRKPFCPNDCSLLLPCHSIRYVVSPWMVNGTVDEYIKKYPTVDHYALVCTSLLRMFDMMLTRSRLKASARAWMSCTA